MNATQVVGLEAIDLGQVAVTDRRPTPDQNRELFHSRLSSIPRDFRAERIEQNGRCFLIVNCDCGAYTEDEARHDKRMLKKSRDYRWQDEDEMTPLPEGWWTWNEFLLDVIEASGFSQRAFAREHEMSEGLIGAYCSNRNARPYEQIRLKIINAAQELGLIKKEE